MTRGRPKRKAGPEYTKLLEEARSVIRGIVQENIPELCRAARDEYDTTDYGFTDEYGNPDNDRQSDSYKYLRNDYVKQRVLHDMRGVLFRDKVKDILCPKESEKVFSMVHAKEGIKSGFTPTERWNRITESWEIMGNFEIKKERQSNGIFKGYTWSKPKYPSEMSKFVESVIDQEINSWK